MRKTATATAVIAGGLAMYIAGVFVAMQFARQPVFETLVPKSSTGAMNLDGATGAMPAALPHPGDIARLPVVSADGAPVGRVAKVTASSGGAIRELVVEIGSFLGLGGRFVKVTPSVYTLEAGRIRLTLTAREVDRLPDANPEERHEAR